MGRGRSLDTSAFVGRSATVGLVSQILCRRRAASRGRAVVLVGEAGVGKTRLAEEVVRALGGRSGTRGDAVGDNVTDAAIDTVTDTGLIVRLNPAMGTLPFGALASVIPVGGHPLDRRSDLLVATADALLQDPERLVVIDDAHLVDRATAGVLHLAASRGSLRLLLTIRSGEPVDPSIVALWKDGFAERIDLDPLDRPDTEELAAQLLGAPLDGVSANDLWEASRGNALFVRELLIGALDEGLVVRHGDVHRFTSAPRTTARLGELLGARLDDLHVDERESLDLLAVAGVLGLELLRSMTGDEAIERLERREMLEVTTDGRRVEVRLVHPLYAELLRARMGKVRELAVHRLLADRLEALGARRRNDVLDLARWRLLGGGDTSPALLLDAARQALFRFDAELARDLAEAAGRRGIGVDADLVVAEAHAQVGRHEEAATVLGDAIERARTDDAVVRAATALSVVQFWALGDEALAMATVREALERVEDPELGRQLDAHAATFVAMANRPTEALERVARHLADGAGRAFTVAVLAAGPALTVVGRAPAAIELVDRCMPIRLALGDDEALPDVFKYTMGKVFALCETGDLAEAAETCTASYDAASEMRAVPGVAWAAMLRGRVALLSGDLDTATARCGEAAELFADLDEQGLRSWSLAGVVLATAMAGATVRCDERVAELDSVDPGPVVAMQADVDRARAWALRVHGDVARAVAALEEAIVDADERGAHGMSVSLLHDLVRVGADDVGRLVRAEHRAVHGELAALRIALVDAATAGDAGDLERCADGFTRLGSPMFATETWVLASAANRRDGAARRAAACLATSLDLRRECPSAATPLLASVSATAELTAREREVAELAAMGASSREIAERLGRSVRTIENHLQRVYEKLGVDGRRGLRHELGAS